MYIAAQKYKNQNHFILRETCKIGDQLAFRDLFDLGQNPSFYIKYPGGNAFYFDEELEDTLSTLGAAYDEDHLEDLFWPWLRPDIKRAVETFRGRGAQRPKLTETEKNLILSSTHPFDKRRIHYLKYASMDQGPVENMPATLFKDLVNNCRDEIEQRFLRMERNLKAHELKSYVYTSFNLQSHFQSFMAKTMPHALDQKKVDTFFVKELCRCNKTLFNKTNYLDAYMLRYAIMFFDHQYAHTSLLDEFSQDFMHRHRFHQPVPLKSVPIRIACKIFDITRKQMRTLTRSQLTRLYRKKARKVHPDTGGSHEKFVELNDAYKTLMEKNKGNPE